MLALLVGLIEIGLGVAKLGFVADLLSSEVRVGYLNGLAITIIVGQLPKLFGFSTDADGFVDEVRAFFDGPRPDQPRDARHRARGPRRAAGPASHHQDGARRARRGRRRHRRLGGARPRRRRGHDRRDAPRRAFPRRPCRGRVGPTSSRCSSAPSASRWCRSPTPSPPRRASPPGGATRSTPTRRWSASAPPTSRPGFFQGFAVSVSGSRTAVADQAGAKSQATGLVGAGLVAMLLLFLNGLLADLPQTALAAVVITAALSLMDLERAAPLRHGAAVVAVISLVATAGVIFLGVLEGIVVAIVLAVLLFFRRNWWPHGAVLGEVPELGGMAQHRATTPTPGERPGVVVFRWEAPLFFANAGQFRDQVRRLVRERAARAGSSCSARRSPTSTSPPRRSCATSTRSSTPRASTSPSSRCATGSRTWSGATGCTRPSIRSTSTRASTGPWPTSFQWRRSQRTAATEQTKRVDRGTRPSALMPKVRGVAAWRFCWRWPCSYSSSTRR